MNSSITSELVLAAEHLLWVLARADVEDLSVPRSDLLRKLDELERRAVALNIPDLYRQVSMHCESTSAIG